jgi:hypothetical protein
MKHVVPVAVGLAAGMAVGFFLGAMVTRHDEPIALGAMVTRHDEPIVVIHNATDETLRWVCIRPDPTKNLWGVPEVSVYCTHELQPHRTFTERLSSHKPTALNVDATKAGGKKLSSEKVNVASRDVVFALISSDGIKLQCERLISF